MSVSASNKLGEERAVPSDPSDPSDPTNRLTIGRATPSAEPIKMLR